MIEQIDYSRCTDGEASFDVCPRDVFRVHKIVYIACPKECIFVGPERSKPIPLPGDIF